MEIQNAWYRISVKALIYNKNGDFLLSKEHNGKWDFPGGGLDHLESPQDCLERELQEEMGLQVKETSKDPKYFLTAEKPNSKSRPWIANVFYEVKVNDLYFTTSDECVEIGFFNKNTIASIEVIENVKEFIKLI